MMIYNCDCIVGAKEYLKDEIFDLLICDPPFGINESKFDQYYARDIENILEGYCEAPNDYYNFNLDWLKEAYRTLKPNGSMYLITGWSNEHLIRTALEKTGFEVINHIIWKYNFGVNTTNKFVSSHYNILYVKKQKGNPIFNTYCRFGPQEKTKDGRSLLYQDLEDVWIINREYMPNQKKNKNKLPTALVEKMILYSSNKDDLVGDFFLGNFTTAQVAHELGRKISGFEINKHSFDLHINDLNNANFGIRLSEIKNVVVEVPVNAGKKIEKKERESMIARFKNLKKSGKTKKAAVTEMQKEFGRGYFSIINVLKLENL